jgi:thiol-disulfide isomerase/thioredoxin
MATRYSRKGHRKFKPRRTARRQSNMGSLSLPLDVRSKGQIGELMKQISKGPLTIVLVYADWCGHCHEFMPHFDKAAKNSNHSIKVVKINETMMPEVNEARKRNSNSAINVQGYPSMMLIGQDGNELTQIEPVKDTEAMTKVMNQSVALANEAGLISEESEMKASIRPNNVRSTPPKVASLKASATPDFIANNSMDMGESEGVSLALNNTKAGKNNHNNVVRNDPSLAMPPSMNDDHEVENNEMVKKGGSLYAAMSQSAYTLAAPAALLATAALMMRRNTRKKHGKRSSHRRKRHGRRRV